MKHRGAWLIALLFAFNASTAQAAPVYSLSAYQSNYTANVGDTVVVEIFLVETLGAGEASALMGTDKGLLAAGFRLDFGASDPAQVLDASGITPNPGFDLLSQQVKGRADGSAWLREDVDFGSPAVQGSETSPGSGVVTLWLGSFSFKVAAAGTTTVAINLFSTDPQYTDFLTAEFDDLDDSIQAGRFTINASGPGVIPEPSSLALAAIAACGLVPVLRRVRR